MNLNGPPETLAASSQSARRVERAFAKGASTTPAALRRNFIVLLRAKHS